MRTFASSEVVFGTGYVFWRCVGDLILPLAMHQYPILTPDDVIP